MNDKMATMQLRYSKSRKVGPSQLTLSSCKSTDTIDEIRFSSAVSEPDNKSPQRNQHYLAL